MSLIRVVQSVVIYSRSVLCLDTSGPMRGLGFYFRKANGAESSSDSTV
jgi:hypothetical protein